MAKGFYVGDDNGVAQKMDNGYIGVGDVSRRINKVYIGDDNGVAQLVYQRPPAVKGNLLDQAIDSNGFKYGHTEIFPDAVNLLPTLTDANGSLYNGGKGYKTNTRLSSSGVEKTQAGIECTGYIPCKLGDVIYLENMICKNTADNPDGSYTYFCVYDENKNYLGGEVAGYFDYINGGVVVDYDVGVEQGNVIQINTANLVYPYSSATPDLRYENMAYFRISCTEITDNSIITVNKPSSYIVSGWKHDLRLNSNGEEVASTGTDVTGFMPFNIADVLHFENMKIVGRSDAVNTTNYIVFYDENFTKLWHIYTQAIQTSQSNFFTLSAPDTTTATGDKYWESVRTIAFQYWAPDNDWTQAKYFRISANEITSDSVITANESLDTSKSFTDVLHTVGYTENMRVAESLDYAEIEQQGTDLTGYIPVSIGDNIFLSNVTMPDSSENYSNVVYFYDSNKTGVSNSSILSSYVGFKPIFKDGNLVKFVLTKDVFGGAVSGYMRIAASNIDDSSIITVNEKIHGTNQIPISIDTDGSIFNEKGYIVDYRINSSGEAISESGIYITGFIPCRSGDIVRLHGVPILSTSSVMDIRLGFYDSSMNSIKAPFWKEIYADTNIKKDINSEGRLKSFVIPTYWSPVAYVRFGSYYMDKYSIITINEENL